MREIKFRGFLEIQKRWVYGNLIVDENGTKYIVDNKLFSADGHHLAYEPTDEPVFINQDTIGQYTGMEDSTGKEIYEGDIIQSTKSKYKRFDNDGIYEVYFNEFLCHFALVDSSVEWHEKHGAYDDYTLTGAKTKDFEVIGNIFDKENE